MVNDTGPTYSENGKVIFRYRGSLHRTDGPAYYWHTPEGNKTPTWWLNGRQYNFKDWSAVLRLTEEDIVMLKLKWGNV